MCNTENYDLRYEKIKWRRCTTENVQFSRKSKISVVVILPTLGLTPVTFKLSPTPGKYTGDMTTLQTTIKKYAEERDKRLAAVRTEEYASFRDHHGLHGLAADPFIDYDKLEKGKPLKDGDEIKFLAIGA
ncbi:FAD-binding monooxygenase ausC [Colletotrichum sp. SAR11_57]|nr:FAD-binding monooxygenase ausC [Colletotrichum sp. SAR11_57]